MSKNWIYRVGTRGSNLALRQVKEIEDKLKSFYPKIKLEIVPLETYGDKDKLTPISDIEGTDFFTREIDDALLKGEIDFSVHSAKDLPDNLPEGLTIAAVTECLDCCDALVSKHNLELNELSSGAKVGVSSQRRKLQLKRYRPDLEIVDLRGNIEERLEKLDNGSYDAIIVAAAALKRLGLENRITERLDLEVFKPHPLQGRLAITIRQDNTNLIELLSILDSREYVSKK